MKHSTYLFILGLIISLSSAYARSPAVLPGVEIEPDHQLQKDLKHAKGRQFENFKPKVLKPVQKIPATEKTLQQNSSSSSGWDGLIFFATLLLPGAISWAIMKKAHNYPVEKEVIDKVLENQDEDEQQDIAKAS